MALFWISLSIWSYSLLQLQNYGLQLTGNFSNNYRQIVFDFSFFLSSILPVWDDSANLYKDLQLFFEIGKSLSELHAF